MRPHQTLAINNILDHKNQILSISTAGGKSLIYTLPAVIMNRVVLVVTPTIVIRNDQVSQLGKMGVKAWELANVGEFSIDYNRLETLDDSNLVFVTPEKLSQSNV